MSTPNEIIFSGGPLNGLNLKNSLGQYLISRIKNHGKNIFQIYPKKNKTKTFETFLKDAINVALEMRKRGVQRGDIVTVCGRNEPDTVLPIYAAIFLGASANPLHAMHTKVETSRMLERTQPKLIFCHLEEEENYKKIKEELNLESELIIFERDFSPFLSDHDGLENFEAVGVDILTTPAIIMCSSGSTGLIKGITHTHNSLYNNTRSTRWLEGTDHQVLLSFAPICWGGSIYTDMVCFRYGHSRLISESCDTSATIQMIEDYKVSLAMMTPIKTYTMTQYCNLEKYELSSLKNILIVGSPSTLEQLKFYRQRFPNVIVRNCYGSTEILSTYTDYTLNELKLAQSKGNTVGRMDAGVQGKVIDSDTQLSLGKNQIGELVITAPSLALGYYNEPEATADSFVDGWFKTGDLVYFDEDEWLYVVGRIKESLKYQTFPIIPAEIEAIIQEYPGVASCCVIGKPHEIDGDHPVAIVVKTTGANFTESDLIEYVDANVNDAQKLRGGVRFITHMPMTSSGKIRRMELSQYL